MKQQVFIIAEAGVNHNGRMDLAFELIDAAARAGADAVKFQTFEPERLVTRSARKAAYQAVNTNDAGSQLDMLRQLALGADQFRMLSDHCRTRSITFLSTAFDLASLDLLARLDMPAIKIPSGDIDYAPMLLAAARLGRKLIISTGMATLGEIEAALGVVAFALTNADEPRGAANFQAAYLDPRGQAALREQVTLLHCVSDYPAPPATINLRAMDTMATAFGLPVGYSDHSAGIEIALAAVARGATIIEKHFTLDRTLPGPDHKASLEPDELTQMVAGIRNIEAALGVATKLPGEREIANRAIVRRSLVATRRIHAGEVFSASDFECKRPAGGLPPIELWDLIGRTSSRDYEIDDPIQP